jgi:hypothetical protein
VKFSKLLDTQGAAKGAPFAVRGMSAAALETRRIAAAKWQIPSLNEIKIKHGQIFAGCACDSWIGRALLSLGRILR